MTGNVDKKDLHLVREHKVGGPNGRGSYNINPRKTFHECNEVQVHYTQHIGLKLRKFEMHQNKYDVRDAA